uniref:Uncharacterized protein n=1 Tax=Arundo donax TaxID=35708 RepID=A0A0A9CFR8_ARUDO
MEPRFNSKSKGKFQPFGQGKTYTSQV